MMIRCSKFMYLWLMYATEMILRCISMFSKRMSCHPPLREVIMRVQYRTIIMEIVVES